MWLRHALKLLIAILIFSACSSSDRSAVDKLNYLSYTCHYRNIDSAELYARRAYEQSAHYADGRSEALNNMAFVSIVRMDYDKAHRQLTEAISLTDNQVEQLIADVQLMRLCQRMSRNREFYDYRERAIGCLKRINEEREELPERLKRRLLYAETELAIVSSTYYYYVGLERQSIEALQAIDVYDDLQRDTAQYLNYLYNVGAGGIIVEGSQAEINQQEFDYLMRCFLLARQYDYPYFKANALEAISEHLLVPQYRWQLQNDNYPAMKFLNPENVDDEMLAGWLAEQSLTLFKTYGDIYQIAGAYRTLASCYHAIGDDIAALRHLEQALSNAKILQAPDLVASIREQLSVAYAAVNDKSHSDYNRNIYLDLQEQTRQDRELEARAAMYDKTAMQLNWMLGAVVVAIVLLLFMLWLFDHLHQRRKRSMSIEKMLIPLRQWQESNELQSTMMQEQMDNVIEACATMNVRLRNSERQHLQQRAKISLVNSVTPLIDRIIHEVKCLEIDENEERKTERLEYIRELTDKINEYNDVLTHWIQLRKGELNLHIESFPLQPLFDIVAKSKTGFKLKGINFAVEPTSLMVKADRILTLFMINTLTDNARKYTDKGGKVRVMASETDDYVEISISDTGCGMNHEQLQHVFDAKGPYTLTYEQAMPASVQPSHGFGLMNCKGIIEKYRKMSRIFHVCILSAESEKGRGSRFYFRLPKGITRSMACWIIGIVCLLKPEIGCGAPPTALDKAHVYADSAYFSNINGTYERTLLFADSCRMCLNRYYLDHHSHGHYLMQREGNLSEPLAEIKWYHDSVATNYQIILDIRNESAVAALALHEWSLYAYNNKVYTQLFKEMSADNSLADYCRMMQQSQTNKTIALVLLLLLLLSILPAYYFLYYRHRLYFRFCVERIDKMNDILLSEASPQEKLERIMPLSRDHYPEELSDVVGKIQVALETAIVMRKEQSVTLEQAKDELRRVEMENNKFYVSNAVLDNCLSTLKHETMYYPNRIRQLVSETKTASLQMLMETVIYYRDIYTLLSLQAMRQIEHVKMHMRKVELYGNKVLGNENLLQYLFELLKNTKAEQVKVETDGLHYLIYTVEQECVNIDEVQAQQLFTPSTEHIDYLLCRQIVRDHGEATNRRGCGIWAEWDSNRKLQIKIKLPRYGQV